MMFRILKINSKSLLRFISFCILSLLLSLVQIAISYSLSSLTASIVENRSYVLSLAFMTLAVYMVSSLSKFVYNQYSSYLAASWRKDAVVKIEDALMSISMEDPLFSDSGRLLTILSSDSEECYEFLRGSGADLVYQLICTSMFLIYIIWLSPLLSAIYIAVSLLTIIIQMLISRLSKGLNSAVKDNLSALFSSLKSLVENRDMISSYPDGGIAYDYLAESQEAYARLEKKTAIYSALLRSIGLFMGFLPIIALSALGLYMVPNSLVSLSSFLAIYYISEDLTTTQLHYADLFYDRVRTLVCFSRIENLVKREKWKRKNESCDSLYVDNLCYGYGEKNILNGLSLEAKKGEKIAIIGESGCGKSTLARIIAGLYTAQKGIVKNPPAVLASQDSFIFSLSVKENIILAEKFDEERFSFACKSASVDKFIKSYDEIVEDNGSKLSGGQRQRIALARALYSSCPLIILDEPFSALDGETVDFILSALKSPCYMSRTFIFILHQEELTSYFDRVYRMRDGRLEEVKR